MRTLLERRGVRLAAAAAGVLALLLLVRPLAGGGMGLSAAAWGAGLAGWLWWRRRRAAPATPRLRCVERLRLSGGRELFLVEIEGRRLLLGCGEGGMRLLSRWPASSAPGGAS